MRIKPAVTTCEDAYTSTPACQDLRHPRNQRSLSGSSDRDVSDANHRCGNLMDAQQPFVIERPTCSAGDAV